MTITLITRGQFNRLSEIQEAFPILTFQNVGYETLNKSKFKNKDHEAHQEVTNILKSCVKDFREFNNFKVRKNGSVVIRFQYDWEGGAPSFTGVGYLLLEELLHGFTPLGSGCKECPYKKNSLPGYLGESSWDPESFLTQLDLSTLHPCHFSVNWEEDDYRKAHVCKGAIQFAKNTAKMLNDPDAEAIRRTLEPNSEFFGRRQDFIDHHSKPSEQ